MKESLIKKYIPLDKSWIIRMGILDILNGYNGIEKFLHKEKNLGDDLLALKKISKIWKTNKPVDVGESGTLYRILKFASWKLNLNKKFIIRGSLKNRKLNNNPEIVNWPQRELLKLDSGTSQWATAAVLCGDKERIKNPPYKLKLTYEALSYWKKQRKNKSSRTVQSSLQADEVLAARTRALMFVKESATADSHLPIPAAELTGYFPNKKLWIPKYDETIFNQAKVYLELLKGKKAKFKPEQAEDFCFAYAFGFITAKEGERRWPSLRNHESDRISEMKKVLEQAKRGQTIISKDHRVIQAIVMWGRVNKKEIKIKYPASVNKSWPQFWGFIKAQ